MLAMSKRMTLKHWLSITFLVVPLSSVGQCLQLTDSVKRGTSVMDAVLDGKVTELNWKNKECLTQVRGTFKRDMSPGELILLQEVSVTNEVRHLNWNQQQGRLRISIPVDRLAVQTDGVTALNGRSGQSFQLSVGQGEEKGFRQSEGMEHSSSVANQ